ncbi:MAG TPA: hypothetical protein PLZ51_02455, partial [Aggregatilineales bacterium]|nr:hypothetical protein [Aggregatilineales bacterium]
MKHNRFITLVVLLASLFALVGGVFAQEEEGITLVLAGWSSSTEETDTLNALLAQFTEETGIAVDWQISTDHTVQMQNAFA